MNVLELFSGTGSVGKVCHKLGWDVVSVDLELPATHECDIMDFDYKQYPKDYFSIVWASPPCTNYSKLQDGWLGRMRKGEIYTKEIQEKEMNQDDRLVLKTFEIIEYFNPELWCVENPATSRMKDRPFMKDKPFYDVSYCMYSDWGYEKKTRIWTNKKDWLNLVCDKSGSCGNMIIIPTDGAKRHDTGKPLKCKTRKLHSNLLCKSETLRAIKKHKLRVSDVHSENTLKHCKSAVGGSSKINGEWVNKGTPNKLDRYRVPEKLILSLFID